MKLHIFNAKISHVYGPSWSNGHQKRSVSQNTGKKKKRKKKKKEEGRNFQLLQNEKNRKVQQFLLYIYKTFLSNEEAIRKLDHI